MSHAPTAEEVAAHEAGIGAAIQLAAIEGVQQPLALLMWREGKL